VRTCEDRISRGLKIAGIIALRCARRADDDAGGAAGAGGGGDANAASVKELAPAELLTLLEG